VGGQRSVCQPRRCLTPDLRFARAQQAGPPSRVCRSKLQLGPCPRLVAPAPHAASLPPKSAMTGRQGPSATLQAPHSTRGDLRDLFSPAKRAACLRLVTAQPGVHEYLHEPELKFTRCVHVGIRSSRARPGVHARGGVRAGAGAAHGPAGAQRCVDGGRQRQVGPCGCPAQTLPLSHTGTIALVLTTPLPCSPVSAAASRSE
jgi:hypothetical protein